jgi:uncharacterized protein (AIM24 family)
MGELAMPAKTIEQFLQSAEDQARDHGFFELERDRLLQVNLNGMVWIKAGAMVAYRGEIGFEREGVLEQGLGQFLKKAVTGEGARLTRATGNGQLYLADSGKKVTILSLAGESLFVNGNDLLAMQDGLTHEVHMLKRVAAVAAGGLFNVAISGKGLIAITTHYDPLALRVRPGSPVYTDPNATVAWSGSLKPEFKTDIQFKTFLGRGSGESFQMKFEGDGFVVVQPFEERTLQAQGS